MGEVVNGTFEHRLGVLEKQMDKLSSTVKDNSDRLICVEKNQETTAEKLEGLSKHTEAIVGMSYEVKNLATKVEDTIELISKQTDKIDKQDDRIDKIENKPGSLAIKAWVIILSTIGTSIIGGVIGYFIK